ncbi:MAG: peptidase S8, partial [Ignavibacteria bacterium]|nr:peptidase S8 [Ignavibacteria bacterium]
AALLLNEELHAGKYEVTWNAANFPSGVYFYVLQYAGQIQSRKMILIK